MRNQASLNLCSQAAARAVIDCRYFELAHRLIGETLDRPFDELPLKLFLLVLNETLPRGMRWVRIYGGRRTLARRIAAGRIDVGRALERLLGEGGRVLVAKEDGRRLYLRLNPLPDNWGATFRSKRTKEDRDETQQLIAAEPDDLRLIELPAPEFERALEMVTLELALGPVEDLNATDVIGGPSHRAPNHPLGRHDVSGDRSQSEEDVIVAPSHFTQNPSPIDRQIDPDLSSGSGGGNKDELKDHVRARLKPWERRRYSKTWIGFIERSPEGVRHAIQQLDSMLQKGSIIPMPGAYMKTCFLDFTGKNDLPKAPRAVAPATAIPQSKPLERMDTTALRKLGPAMREAAGLPPAKLE